MKTRLQQFALITGAGGGLGSAFALEAVRKGWNLLLVDLPESGVRELGERLERAYQVEVHSVAVDLADSGERERLVQWIVQQGMEVGLLINNAGTGSCSSFETAPLPRLAGIIDVNVQALMQLTYLLLPCLKRLPRATIINVSSLAAFYPMPSMAVYAATKSFILNFSLAIRHELAGTGVTVSALCPAGMVTNRDSADQVEAQGFFGRITTWYPERVAAVALRQALRGRDVIIPGAVNRLIRWASSMAPRWLVVRLIGGRWQKAATHVGASVAEAPTV
jgi:short-subunit dehydrogenase